MNASVTTLILGTRGSTLARMQSQLIADALEQRHSNLHVELRVIQTSGDQITDKPLHEAGGKGLFTKELELALLAGTIDFAVHSYKDVPMTMPLVETADLIVAATPQRQDPRDVLITRAAAKRLEDMPTDTLVGTSSLRRMCQLLAVRPDVRVQSIRGNIDTRLRKLAEGQYDAIILAMAGLRRAGLLDEQWMWPLDIEQMLPAPGQGALALQCRSDNARVRQFLQALHHPPTEICVNAEREVVRLLEGDCHSPIAALATLEGETMELRIAVGSKYGKPPVTRASVKGNAAQNDELARRVVEKMEKEK